MSEVSNRALSFLVIMTLLVSITTIYTSQTKLNNMQERLNANQATGFATSSRTGTATINLSGSVSIALNVNSLDWGIGVINQTKAECATGFSLTTNETGGTTTLNPNNCWINTTLNAAEEERQDFEIENTGTNTIRLDVNATNATNFLGFGDATNTGFSWHAENGETGTCISGLNTTTWNSFNNESRYDTACDIMNYSNNADLIDILINISFERDIATTGQKTATVYFRAENATVG